jgi:CheY-like chemotaxis protein
MILVVDDDKVLAKLLRKLLEDGGYTVQVANNGEEAYKHLKDPECLGMLLDMRMPGINGAELLMLMTAENIDVPVIVMAAFPDFEEEELKQFGNVKRLFHKPFYPDEMLAAVQELTGAKT